MSRQLPNGTKLAAFYQADLSEQDLISECKHFKHHICCWRQNTVPHSTVYEMYSLIKADSLESTFPNIETALRIYLTMMLKTAQANPHSLNWRLLKTISGAACYSQDTSLAVMSIESDIYFSDIVRSFAENKSRKK